MLGDVGIIDRSVWRFNAGLKKYITKKRQKQSQIKHIIYMHIKGKYQCHMAAHAAHTTN